MRNGNGSFNAFFGFIIFMAFVNGGFGAAFPLLIFYFIVNSLISKKKKPRRVPNRRYSTDRERARRQADLARQRAEQARREAIRKRRGTPPKINVPKRNPFKKSGVAKFKDYDYKGAIQDFEKALTIDPNDQTVHFNLAASYSLDENKEKSFAHLDKAVSLGFKDFEKINSHDALAFLRIQDEFEAFKANSYRIVNKANKKKMETVAEGIDPNLLEQLNRLQDLREKGVLTEEEFIIQKKKILR